MKKHTNPITKAQIVLTVKGKSFILKTTNINLAILYNVMEIKVAIAAPLIQYKGMNIALSVIAKNPKSKPKNKTALQYLELKMIALLFPKIKSKYLEKPSTKTTKTPSL